MHIWQDVALQQSEPSEEVQVRQGGCREGRDKEAVITREAAPSARAARADHPLCAGSGAPKRIPTKMILAKVVQIKTGLYL